MRMLQIAIHSPMTGAAYGLYIFPMLPTITQIVVIHFCLLSTIASISLWFFHFALSNQIMDCSSGPHFIRTICPANPVMLLALHFTLITLLISLLSLFYNTFPFFSLPINLLVFSLIFVTARFAPRCMSTFTKYIFGKICDWLDFLAFATTFCLNCFRHGDLLIRLLCSGPTGSAVLPVGSFILLNTRYRASTKTIDRNTPQCP